MYDWIGDNNMHLWKWFVEREGEDREIRERARD
jgi:hypothetical protein